jgi:hypothetical protein
MKNNLSLTLLCILSGALAAPQNDLLQSIGGLLGGAGGLRNILNNPVIQGRILSNNLNPCDGVPPSTCQCTNGESIPFSIEYRDNPCLSQPKKIIFRRRPQFLKWKTTSIFLKMEDNLNFF